MAGYANPLNNQRNDFGGNNQYMNYPTMPGAGYNPPNPYGSGSTDFNPYQVPPQNSPVNTSSQGMFPTGHVRTEKPIDPGLTSEFFNYLQSQIGQGVSPFNLSTMLPDGTQTQKGQLTAGANPILQQLMQLFSGGGPSGAGLQQLQNIATNGIDATPEWQKMIRAQQQNIQQNEANLKEQFAGMGNLAGSPFGTAMSNYAQQTTLDENSLLGQLQQQNILQGQIPAGEFLQNLSLQQTQMKDQFGQYMQGLDQSAITNQLNEFIRTSPQYNPLLSMMFGGSTTFAPLVPSQSSGGGILGGLLPGLMSGAGAGIGAAADGASASEALMAGLAAM
jgi:hypothetical protein